MSSLPEERAQTGSLRLQRRSHAGTLIAPDLKAGIGFIPDPSPVHPPRDPRDSLVSHVHLPQSVLADCVGVRAPHVSDLGETEEEDLDGNNLIRCWRGTSSAEQSASLWLIRETRRARLVGRSETRETLQEKTKCAEKNT